MRLNESTALVNDRIVLRPYRRWHVPRYHEWMSSDEMRDATASERLTLEQEEDMQKLTFIIHLRQPSASSPILDPAGFLAAHSDPSTMLGDVNLFLHAPSSPPPSSSPPSQRAEMEIMLPPSDLFKPRTGLASLSLRTFLSYSSRALHLPPSAFFARIGFDNEASLGLFKSLGFREGKRVEVFREVEVVWPTSEEGERWPWEGKEGWEVIELEDPRDEERD
ncbi:Drug/metabolite transporter superfamily [Rhodotorula toruloides]